MLLSFAGLKPCCTVRQIFAGYFLKSTHEKNFVHDETNDNKVMPV